MLIAYVCVFLIGCGVGAVVSDIARRRRQRALTRAVLQAIDSGQLRTQSGRVRASLADERVDDAS